MTATQPQRRDRRQNSRIPIYLTSPTAAQAKHTHRFQAVVSNGSETRLIDVLVVNDGTPNRPKIVELLKLKFGSSWELDDFWCPEPADTF